MNVFFFVVHLSFVHIIHSLNVTISGKAYIEPGMSYNVSCTVDEYRDDRQTTFSARSSDSNQTEIVVWYFKPFGCFQLSGVTVINCTSVLCDCEDNGLTTHWIYRAAPDLSTPVTFVCSSSDTKAKIVQSDPYIPLIADGPDSDLIFNQSNNSITKIVGQEFSVTCSVSCTPSCQFQWTKLTSVVSNGSLLHIPKLSKDDNGTYECRARNGYGPDGMKTLYLTVNYDAKSVRLFPTKTQYTVTEGDTMQAITCTADCRPACNYTWFGPNGPASTTYELHLQNIKRNQRGVFYCTASNVVGSLNSSDVNVNIQFGPGSSLEFKPNFTSVTKNKGQMLGQITCSATCNPPCNYTWTKPDNTIIDGGQLTVGPLSIADHGLFICTASNDIGNSMDKHLNVTVNYGPESVTLNPLETQYNVTEGNNILHITCKAFCRPACNYTWFGPNVIAGTTEVLTLPNIRRNQRGVYYCTAYNDVGNLTSSDVNINIQFGPGQSLQFHPNDTSVTKNQGDTLGPIECIATCNPPCQFSWTKPDTTIIKEDELTIYSLSLEDHGPFICIATNGIGDSEKRNLDVIVNYGPVDVILSPPTKHYIVKYLETVHPINCTANCRPKCKYNWTGPNVPSDTGNVLSLQNIQKNQSGEFNCRASNEVSSMQSSIINVDVQYKPFVNQLSINGSNFTVRESTTVILYCNVDGNPSPTYTWNKNSILLSEAVKFNDRSVYTIQQTQCEDSGIYSCIANNSLGMSSLQQSLFVTCSPRLNFEVAQPPTKIGLPKGANLNLTVHLISYPTPTSTEWYFQNDERNKTNIGSSFHTTDLFKHITVVIKTNLTQFDFGDYILKVDNTIGTETQTYHVIPQGSPDPSTLLNATCDVLSAVLYWKTAFNGGETQNFSIIVQKDEKEKYIYDTNIYDDEGETIKFFSMKLSAGDYIFTVYGENSYGNQNSTNEMPCQVKDDYTSESSLSIGAAAGGGTAAAIIIVLIVVVIVFIKKKRSSKGDDGRRNLTTEDKDDDDGLKENPLYVSSGEASNESGPLYSVVMKNVKSDVTAANDNSDQGPVYSLVQKVDTKGKVTNNKKNGKKTGKQGNSGKGMEMGSVYENSKNLIINKGNDEVYTNAVINARTDNTYRPTKNKDGLIYADLDLEPCAGGNKFVIRGLENRSNYAIIDLTKTAEPLPSDEEEDGEKSN